MTKSRRSSRWYQAHVRDPYVRRAQREDYRSRAAYKLMEIDRKERLFKPGQIVLDLGAAPGSWSQYAAARVGRQGRILAVDLLPMEPIGNVACLQGDIADPAVADRCLEWLGGARADLVISDLAPNLTGISATDQARMLELAGAVRQLACRALRPGGDLLIKLFQGEEFMSFVRCLEKDFQRVVARKPPASRGASREMYVLGRGFVV
jgi:23S rRNA (uridine2552-2'-O)-methyltransferase